MVYQLDFTEARFDEVQTQTSKRVEQADFGKAREGSFQ